MRISNASETPGTPGAQGLTAMMQEALRRIGSAVLVPVPLEPTASDGWTRVRSGERMSQVVRLRSNEHPLHSDFWNRGVYLAGGLFPDIESLARAIDVGGGLYEVRTRSNGSSLPVNAGAAAVLAAAAVPPHCGRAVPGTADQFEAG